MSQWSACSSRGEPKGNPYVSLGRSNSSQAAVLRGRRLCAWACTSSRSGFVYVEGDNAGRCPMGLCAS